MLSKASRAFTEWYHNRGYGYNPVFNEWLCPWWVKLLMPLLFSPSIYAALYFDSFSSGYAGSMIIIDEVSHE